MAIADPPQARRVTGKVTRVDRDELTTQLLAFTAARLFGDSHRETLTQAEVEAVLTAEHLEHRRQHVEGWTSSL